MPVACEVMSCTKCSLPGPNVCALCRIARYCSASCAQLHWVEHRHICVTSALPPGVRLPDCSYDAEADGPALQLPPPAASLATPRASNPAVAQPAVVSPTKSPRGPPLSKSAQDWALDPMKSPREPFPRVVSPPVQPSRDTDIREWDRTEALSSTEFTKVLVTAAAFCELWVNVFRNGPRVLALHEQLAAKAELMPSFQPRVNAVCAGCYEGQWCRVKVLSVVPTLTVRYIDFGNEEPIALRDLRMLPAEMMLLPAQAIRIRIRGGNQKKYDLFKMDSVMFVKFVEQAEDGAAVVQVEGDVSLPVAASVAVVSNAGISTATGSNAPAQNVQTLHNTASNAPQPPLKIPTQDLPDNKFTQVVVLEQCDTGYLVNVMANGHALLDMQKSMAPLASRWETVVDPCVGDLVAAEFVDDSGTGWYRAQVRSLAPLRVLFLDYGNVAEGRGLRRLPAAFAALPAQAIKVALRPGTPPRFHRLPANSLFNVRRVDKNADFVTVEVEDMTAEKAVNAPAAPAAAPAAAPELKCVDLPTGQFIAVTVAESRETDFLATVDGNAEASYRLVARLTERAASLRRLEPPQLRLGDLVAAIFCGEWYRGRITQLSPLRVYYVDYGNSETLTQEQVRELPDEFFALPSQVVRLELAPGSSPEFRGLPTNTQLGVKVVARHGDIFVVQVEGDVAAAVPATGVTSNGGEVAVPCLLPEAVAANSTLEVYFVSRLGTRCFVQRQQSAAVLLSMDEEAKTLASQLPALRPAVGAVVFVLFDGGWSRAVVLSTIPEICVRFLDYGNEACVGPDDIREMPGKFAQVAAQCWRVCFSADTPASVAELDDYSLFRATFLSQDAESTWTIRGQMI